MQTKMPIKIKVALSAKHTSLANLTPCVPKGKPAEWRFAIKTVNGRKVVWYHDADTTTMAFLASSK